MAPSTELTRHSFALRSHLSETSHARELVLPFAVEAGFSAERCFDIQVASSEACANAIEHSPADCEVEFTVLVHADRLEIQVEGHGQFELPAVAARERVHRGLGLPLMAKLSDHMSLYSGPRGGTLVALTFYSPGFQARGETDDITPPSIRDLIEENEHFRTVFENAGVGMVITDPQGGFVLANGAFLDLLGYELDEFLRLNVADITHLEDFGVQSPIIEEMQAGNRSSFELEKRYRAKDGSIVWAHLHASFVCRADGEPEFGVAVVQDISERKRAEEALRDSEMRFRSLFEYSPDAVFLTIPTGKILAANPGASAIFGYSDEEFRSIGRDGVLDAGDPRLVAGLEERRRTGAVQAWELTGIRKNGERFPAEVDSVILPGKPDTSFVIMRDITKRKRAEETLRESENRLRQQWEELRLIYESVPAGLALLDRELRYLRVNERLAQMNGMPVAAHIGRTVREVIPGFADELERLLRPVIETGEPIVDFEWRGETAAKSGVERAWIVPILDEDGGVEMLGAVILEITERVKTERSERNSQPS